MDSIVAMHLVCRLKRIRTGINGRSASGGDKGVGTGVLVGMKIVSGMRCRMVEVGVGAGMLGKIGSRALSIFLGDAARGIMIRTRTLKNYALSFSHTDLSYSPRSEKTYAK
jgi:hypothetical protein